MSAFSQITYEVDDSVATITLNRPDRLNAFTATMCRELVAAFDAADADDHVRVVLLTGAGRPFCAGAHLAAGARTLEPRDVRQSAGRPAFRARCVRLAPRNPRWAHHFYLPLWRLNRDRRSIRALTRPVAIPPYGP